MNQSDRGGATAARRPGAAIAAASRGDCAATLGDHHIRLARAEDIPALADIERRAAATFRTAGIDGAFLDSTVPPELLQQAALEGRLWLAERHDHGCVGFALVELRGDVPHLEEIDVDPDHGRRGIGADLVRTVAAWAQGLGAASLTLSTFRDVAWNAPFYARLGFREITHDETTPALRALAEAEASRGLPMERRVQMRLELSTL